MSFLMTFARQAVEAGMENNDERNSRFVEHVTVMKDRSEIMKATWSQPQKFYGFWNDEKNNMKHKYMCDTLTDKFPGRKSYY
mmetsp:Transcript_39219/g.54456  ORF Transcript_39219/g.54456 Transcript_39219/m.54456 type:complete len:82 (+) Transcript_39219:95-340(+)|eukprot:CAMPEP_0196579368 /NCGR_PEP_ID=MMETSP1081-20130531/20993_1 /TAXON_ID=36882 /ORGANISM="Pyramimonas amylifera, Strain CCMP720" /LENGTH=81 /DNA_ID=CAMNT_0041898927 /DNA_START=81 /DNA_END=326 /DNA_ORIENTATION=-